jgi:hypothetical protein
MSRQSKRRPVTIQPIPTTLKLIMRPNFDTTCVPTSVLAFVVGCAILTGCGGSGGSTPSGEAQIRTADRADEYAATMDYCGSREPTGNSAQPGGWEFSSPSHTSSPVFDVNALVSPAGTSDAGSFPLSLQVGDLNYHGVVGNLVLPGSAQPQWKMGMTFSPVLPAKAAACVIGLAKVSTVWGPMFDQPGGGIAPTGNSVAWSSSWSASVPVDSLPGKIVDGFEFKSTFIPADSSASFVLSKSSVPSSTGASICYLAPSSSQWDCAAAAAADRGADWAFSRQAGKAGVYVLVTL